MQQSLPSSSSSPPQQSTVPPNATQQPQAPAASTGSSVPAAVPASATAAASTTASRNQPPNNNTNDLTNADDWTENFSNQFEEVIGKPSREAIHDFFYPQRSSHASTPNPSLTHGNSNRPPTGDATTNAPTTTRQRSPTSHNRAGNSNHRNPHPEFDAHFAQQQQQDQQFVHRFWTIYDDILILSLFTQLGIVVRLASSTWLAIFDNVFNAESPLFVNLPLNCLSSFIMGLLCPGEHCMEIIHTRFSPPRLQHTVLNSYDDPNLDNDDDDAPSTPLPLEHQYVDEDLEDNAHTHRRRSPRPLSVDEDDDEEEADGFVLTTPSSSPSSSTLRRRRGAARTKRQQTHDSKPYFHSWQPPAHWNQELRDVQLLALERRIRASKCLVLFPVKKQDVDVMEHYFTHGYQQDRHEPPSHSTTNAFQTPPSASSRQPHEPPSSSSSSTSGIFVRPSNQRGPSMAYDLELQESTDVAMPSSRVSTITPPRSVKPPAAPTATINEQDSNNDNPDDEDGPMTSVQLSSFAAVRDSSSAAQDDEDGTPTATNAEPTVDQMLTEVRGQVTENFHRLRRVNIADGWDAGTTPEAMSDDIMLGLRDGFCGALSSFSSWNSAMVHFVRRGALGKAAVGYLLGLQLPIIAYRFGQHVAVYVFIWRCRYEAKRDERRGYGIRVSQTENEGSESGTQPQVQQQQLRPEDESPSLRAIITAIFIMALVTQCTSLSFFTNPKNQELALSLLFSPLGVLARWRLSQLNTWRPTFPMGTFTANMLACALSGGLGRLLAGNPGPRERIALQSFINGFGGTMSSLATFVVEVLAGIDPVLLRIDGMFYACWSIFCAMAIGLVFETSVDWADATE